MILVAIIKKRKEKEKGDRGVDLGFSVNLGYARSHNSAHVSPKRWVWYKGHHCAGFSKLFTLGNKTFSRVAYGPGVL